MRINKKGSLIALLLAVCVLAFASLAAAADKAPVLRMATTTSTDDTGLLDYLAPICLKDTGIDVQWVAVGTGKALEFGRNGDVDVVLTHAPSQEDKFEAEGYGVDRRKVMYNDFVLIGPANDPAGVKGKPVIEAIATIAEKQQKLVSRADKSGTHTAELKLLDKAGVKDFDKAAWYVQTGQGMLKTINIAEEQGDAELLNKYSVMAVNPEKHPEAKHDLAVKYIEWITSPKVQQDIANFKLEGKQLFFPDADPAK